MATVVRLAGLGRAARSSANIKLRQPLARATVAVRTRDEAGAVERLSAHLARELNVKEIEVIRDEGALVTYSLRPVLPKLGPKYGQQLPAIRQALEAADAVEVAVSVAAEQPVKVEAEGAAFTLLPDEIEVLAAAREGLVTAEEHGYVVAIATELTADLIAEGLSRDLVRHIQQLRKDSGLDITDRIALSIDCSDEVQSAVQDWRDYVMGEVLAPELEFGAPSDAVDGSATVEIRGQAVTLGISRL
jgi:isoleucyl-tRNA synthetase